MTPDNYLRNVDALLQRCRVRLSFSVGCACVCAVLATLSLALTHGQGWMNLFTGIQMSVTVASVFGARRSYRWWKLVREIRRVTAIQFNPKAPVSLRQLADDQANAAYAELKRMSK